MTAHSKARVEQAGQMVSCNCTFGRIGPDKEQTYSALSERSYKNRGLGWLHSLQPVQP